jgi:hypothetical protein
MKPTTRLSLAPRAHLFTARRTLTTSTRLRKEFANPFTSPAPPRLPQEDQKVFEELVQQSTGAFSSPRSPPKINQSPDSSPSEAAAAQGTIAARAQNIANSEMGAAAAQAAESSKVSFQDAFKREIDARGKGEELHPNVRRGAPPEFEGDVNPKTGEVGGPKNEPLRWGAEGEWAYNGRTTDF